ncbi:MAG: hypothetical protein H7328_07870 [Bdellovibrio sp.]|nr:hypothetical protein [Bdellovibrio sp.]
MRKIFGVIIFTFFSLNFVSQSFAQSCFENYHESGSAAVDQHNVDDHHGEHVDEKGHCHAHVVQCCHLTAVLQKNTQLDFSGYLTNSKYLVRTLSVKASPFLDGPYRPPQI